MTGISAPPLPLPSACRAPGFASFSRFPGFSGRSCLRYPVLSARPVRAAQLASGLDRSQSIHPIDPSQAGSGASAAMNASRERFDAMPQSLVLPVPPFVPLGFVTGRMIGMMIGIVSLAFGSMMVGLMLRGSAFGAAGRARPTRRSLEHGAAASPVPWSERSTRNCTRQRCATGSPCGVPVPMRVGGSSVMPLRREPVRRRARSSTLRLTRRLRAFRHQPQRSSSRSRSTSRSRECSSPPRSSADSPF